MRRDEWRDNDRNRLIFASPRRVHSRERYDRAEVRGWKARKRIVERLGACRRNGATGENARPAARDAINDEIISTNCVRPFQRFQGPYDSRSCFSSFTFRPFSNEPPTRSPRKKPPFEREGKLDVYFEIDFKGGGGFELGI